VNFKRIAAIAADPDFLAFVALDREQLTRKVMSAATSPEDREKALTDYHAIARLVARMGSAVQEAQKDTDE
jgi:hypothetical protein